MTRTQLEKIQILYVLQFAGISCARSIYFMATNHNFVRMLYLLCGNKRVFCAHCMRFLFVFLFVPTLIVHAGSLKATKGNSTSVCTFSTAPLELFSQIRFWLDSDVKKQNKQTRRNKDKKKTQCSTSSRKRDFFFFQAFQASPASHPPFSPCQLWPHSGGEVAWGGVGWWVGSTVSLALGRASTRPFWSEGRTRAPSPTACYPGWTLHLLAPTTE